MKNSIHENDKWDLSKIFKDINDFEECITLLNASVEKVLSFKDKILNTSDSLYQFYISYEYMNRLSEKLYVYTNMLADSDTTNSEYKSLKMKIDKLVEDIYSKTSFINSELLRADYNLVLKYIKENPKLNDYAFDLEKIFRYKEHTLSEKEEKLIIDASNAFGTGYEVFYNFNNADIYLGKIKNDKNHFEELTISNYSKFMNSKNRNVRKKAFIQLHNYYKRFNNSLSATYNGKIKENFFLSNSRNFKSPLEASLYADAINKKVYTNLIDTVHKHIDKMSEYIDLKKKYLNLKQMHMWDISVEIMEIGNDKISFEEGKKIVFESLKPLGEQYISDLSKAFSERWIDKYPVKGKKSGAYSWGSYDTYPYLLLNYDNTLDSVSTMTHELGHSMHSYYSQTNQNATNYNYPIFLAEIASTVNEMLLNEYLYKNAKNKQEKIFYLFELLDKIRTTIYRQTMFAEFEMKVHDMYEKGESLTSKLLCKTYLELNKFYYPNILSDDYIQYEWSRIPHFYTSFYVYKYATGLSAAIAISNEILNGNDKAKELYLKFLSSGGSDYPLEILKLVGVDMNTSYPIEQALNLFNEKLNELKKLVV